MNKYRFKYFYFLTLLIVCGGLIIQIFSLSHKDKTLADNKLNQIITIYQPSQENFPNPERGFAIAYDPPWPNKITWETCNPSVENSKKYNYTQLTERLQIKLLKQDRTRNISLAMVRYHLAKFRNKPLTQAFLERLEQDFRTARQAGVKLVIRFVYNWPMGGPDAPVEIVLEHLEQLKPIFYKNVDIIAFMDAGFIGCWGEWHHSSNNLLSEDKINAMNENSIAILNKIFEVLPKDRMVAVRYPLYKFQYFGAKEWKPIVPLTNFEAFDSSKKARWGQHDDCLVCGEWNYGTYWSPRHNALEIRHFLEKDNRYVVQSGEPGDPATLKNNNDEDRDGYTLGNHESCSRVLKIFSQMHWSVLSANYNLAKPISYKRWQKEGCYKTITKKLGYRFRLINSFIPVRVRPGGNLSMMFTIINEGWASPYNPRALEIVLRNQINGKIFRFSLQENPRFWQPGEIHTINIQKNIPRNIPSGQYEVLLNLPDPTPSLYNRPEYSIQMANRNIWEKSTGYNSFLRSIAIK